MKDSEVRYVSSEFGNRLKISVFGRSHAKAIGVSIDGLPAGERIDMSELMRFMRRRSPGGSPLSASRDEKDIPVFLSGIKDSVLTGERFCAIIENTDANPSDYSGFEDTPRPSHADYTAWVKWRGEADMRGGGQFSGRLTAPMCVAGAIAKQILARKNIFVGAHLASVGTVDDDPFDLKPGAQLFDLIADKDFPVINDAQGEKMKKEILRAKENLDSVGGVVECAVIGLPAGLGEPMFGGMESKLSFAVFGIPAVKGVEFGSGFAGSRLTGSVNNDSFYIDENGEISTLTNNCGGILGGITDGMPLTLRAAVKPTPSIEKKQRTVSLSERISREIEIKGRHDPCIAHRAVPAVEAVVAAVILDTLLS